MSPRTRRPTDLVSWPVRRTLNPRFADLAHRMHLLSERVQEAAATLRGDIARSEASVLGEVARAGAETHGVRARLDVLTRQLGAIERRFAELDPETNAAVEPHTTEGAAPTATVERPPPRAMADLPSHPGTPEEQAEIARRVGQTGAIVAVYATQHITLRDGSSLNCFPIGIPVADAVVLHELVRDHDRQRTLETGLGFGISAAVIAANHARRGDGTHVAMDPFHQEWFGGAALELIERVGAADHTTVLERASCVALAGLEAEGTRIDFAFIDENHHFDATLVDFYLVDRMLEPGGHVVLHDVWMQSVRRVLDFVVANRDYVEEPYPDPMFLAVLRKERRTLATGRSTTTRSES